MRRDELSKRFDRANARLGLVVAVTFGYGVAGLIGELAPWAYTGLCSALIGVCLVQAGRVHRALRDFERACQAGERD